MSMTKRSVPDDDDFDSDYEEVAERNYQAAVAAMDQDTEFQLRMAAHTNDLFNALENAMRK